MRVNRRVVRMALVVLALAGFLISFYLTITHYRNAIPPCHVISGCESVLTSRYAVILGIPLSLLGTIYFALMYYLSISMMMGPRKIARQAYELLVFVGVLAAILLFLLQAVVLKAYCTYCLATEAIALLIWAGSLFAASSEEGGAIGGGVPGRADNRRPRR